MNAYAQFAPPASAYSAWDQGIQARWDQLVAQAREELARRPPPPLPPPIDYGRPDVLETETLAQAAAARLRPILRELVVNLVSNELAPMADAIARLEACEQGR